MAGSLPALLAVLASPAPFFFFLRFLVFGPSFSAAALSPASFFFLGGLPLFFFGLGSLALSTSSADPLLFVTFPTPSPHPFSLPPLGIFWSVWTAIVPLVAVPTSGGWTAAAAAIGPGLDEALASASGLLPAGLVPADDGGCRSDESGLAGPSSAVPMLEDDDDGGAAAAAAATAAAPPGADLLVLPFMTAQACSSSSRGAVPSSASWKRRTSALDRNR